MQNSFANFRRDMPKIRIRGGFTLVEVIATIAMIVIISTIFIGGLSRSNFFSTESKTVERALIDAVKSSANVAQTKNRYTELVYDRRGFYEILDYETAEVYKRIFLNPETEKAYNQATKENKKFVVDNIHDLDDVVFVLEKPMIYGKEQTKFLLKDRQSIIFAPDGTCSQFTAVIKSTAFEKPLEIKYDNFSATPYENKK